MDWDWVGPPIDVRALFPAERRELLALLHELEAPDWQRATVCPGWTVHDITAHVVHDYIRRLSGAHDGDLWSGPAPGEQLPAFIDRMNQEFVDVARRWSPAVLLDLLDHLGPQVDHMWAGQDPHAVAGLDVWWADPGVPAPVWLDVAREYSEFWVHQQQIRDAVQRPGADDAALMGPVIDAFLRGLPNTLAAHPAAPGASVRVEVDGPAGGIWVATRDAARWRLDRRDDNADDSADDAPADAVVRMSPDTLWRLATRGLTPEQARERSTIGGDEALARAALDLLSIIR
jgi:uncharacterized protein (TIGR03083 family)